VAGPSRNTDQLSLPLGKGDKGHCVAHVPATKPTNVVPFTDAKTLEIRQQAIARVEAAGIFSVSLQHKK
jgi:hypothetical protein